MTAPQETIDTADAGSNSITIDDGTPGSPTGEAPEDHSGSRLHREAAKYRTQLRDTEAERDTLQARVEAMQLHQVEHYAGQHLSDPTDLLALSGLELAELLTEDGFADPDKIRVAAAGVVATRPGLGLNSPAVDFTQGSGNVAPGRGQASWGSLLQQ
jgi:hypothetical protein